MSSLCVVFLPPGSGLSDTYQVTFTKEKLCIENYERRPI